MIVGDLAAETTKSQSQSEINDVSIMVIIETGGKHNNRDRGTVHLV